MKILMTITLTLSSLICSSQTVSPKTRKMALPPLRTWQAILEEQLNDIQSGDTNDVASTVYDIATTWAAAGFIDQANQLLSRFWGYKTKDPDDFTHTNDGFSVLWALSGKKPGYIPFDQNAVNDIVQANWDDLFNIFPGIASAYPPPAGSWKGLSGPPLLAKALSLCSDVDKPDHRATRQSQEEAVQAFTRYFEEDTLAGYDLYRTGTAAAIVAATLGHDALTKKIILRGGIGYLRYPESFMLVGLMKDTATARWLLQGILAPVWGITDSSCTADLQKIEAKLDQRVKKGPSLVFGQLSLTALLQRLSDSAISQKDLDYDKIVYTSRWLGHPPAAASRIRAAEKRLGVALPDDYKSFLLLTNGFRCPDNVGVTFLPIDSIGWLRDLNGELAALWGKPMDEKEVDRAAAFRRSILIGGLHEEQQFLLIPPGGKDKEWQYWYFACWSPGETPYPSLRFFLESQLQLMMNH